MSLQGQKESLGVLLLLVVGITAQVQGQSVEQECQFNGDCLDSPCCIDGVCESNGEACFEHYHLKECETHLDCDSCCLDGLCGSLSDCFSSLPHPCSLGFECPVCCLPNGFCGDHSECYLYC